MVALWFQLMTHVLAQSSAPVCRIDGRVVSGTTPLPGASVIVFAGDERRAQTTSAPDGRFSLTLAPEARYRLTIDLAFFEPVSRDVVTTNGACDQMLAMQLALQPRSRPPLPPAVAGPRTALGGRAARFERLNVQPDTAASAPLESTASDEAELQRLLPPGFSAQAASADAVAINGSNDAAQVDRRMMNDRLDAIGRGDFAPGITVFGPGFVPGGAPGSFGPGGPGGPGPFGPGGGFGPPGGFFLGGRGGRQNTYQGSATYSFGGSLLDTAPFQLRPEVASTQPQFVKNNFGMTAGGPFRIPGLYKNTELRSRFQVNYLGGRANNVFNQYATVPTDAMRSGDFSASPLALVDPLSGLPFADNRIPAGRVNAAALALLPYIPRANLPGTAQNYQVTTLAHTTSDDLSLRFIQNLSPNVVQTGAGGGARSGGGGGGLPVGPRGAARAGRGAARGTNIILNGQLQIRRTNTEAPNVFSALNGENSGTSIAAPLSLNIVRGRTIQGITVSMNHSTSSSTNRFVDVLDASGLAGIQYPGQSSIASVNWGIPDLSFATLSAARLSAATVRSDSRLTLGYNMNRPIGRHQLGVGGDFRLDRSTNQNNSNARGSFLFTGIYTAPDAEVAGDSGADFADFLLGMPQQATLQAGGTTELRGRSFSAFIQDNWRHSSRLTFNMGLRYELVLPYSEAEGRMANLDVTPDFTAALPVVAGATAPYTGRFPAALIDADVNNVGPRLGVAFRPANGSVLRGGYSITYNNGSYGAIARQLSGQPPFSFTQTILGSPTAALRLQTALLSSTSATTNNWGVDRHYALGKIQTWNAAVSRDVGRNWSLSFTYTGTKGSSLDILRAPNRGPGGLRIPDVQAFIWESFDGHSLLNSATWQVRRRQAGGLAANISYTLAKSMDNASSIGAGATVVAQDDQDLDAEWARSNFDRRHQFSGQASWEVPFGANRHWLSAGGLLAALVGNWNASANFTYQSGSPFTPRVSGAASDAARGTSGSLRANYDGRAIAVDNPTVAQFFNTSAFSVPAANTFGNAARNIITGPASHQLNAMFSRDLTLGGNRGLTLSLNASNVLNTVQWSTIDTNLNSATFGQVLAVRPMRTMTANLRMRF